MIGRTRSVQTPTTPEACNARSAERLSPKMRSSGATPGLNCDSKAPCSSKFEFGGRRRIDARRGIRKAHPLRRIKQLADAALQALSATFDVMYAKGGRPSVAPERLLKSTLLMAFYRVRSDRLFCEQLDYDLLARRFLGMDMLEEAFNHSTFSKNRERLLEHDVAKKFLAEIVPQAHSARPMSDDHFTVDGRLIEGWASVQSFRPTDEEPEDRPPPDDPGNPTVTSTGRSAATIRTSRRRIRNPSCTEEPEPGGEALVLRQRADGEPKRADRRPMGRACDRVTRSARLRCRWSRN
jgi:transposase